MSQLARPTLRLIVGPAVVAAFAGFELRHTGTLAAIAAGWCVFVLCVLAIGAWEKIQLERTRHRLPARRSRRSGRTR